MNKKNAELIVKYVQEQPKGNRCSTGQESAERTFQRPGGRRYAGKGEKKTKSKPSTAGSIWRGGAREWADVRLASQRRTEQNGLCSDEVAGLEPAAIRAAL